MNARLAIAFAACAITSVMASSTTQPGTTPVSGVRVESTGPPWSGASKAGLRPGDVIFAWALPETEPAGTHAVAMIADWYEAEAEHGLRQRGVVVSFVRDEQIATAPLRGGAWVLGVAPLLTGERRAAHERATAQAAGGESAAAAATWRVLAEQTSQDPDPSLAAWFWLRAGGGEMAARNAAGAVTAYGSARAAASERAQPLLEREALDSLARAHQAGQQPVAAEAALSDAVALLQAERPNSPALVRTLNGLAAAQREFGRLDESERTYQRALDLARIAAPASIAEVASLGGLSLTLRRRGDRTGAERLLDEAAQVLERFPDHPDRIANAANRGILLVEQNRLAEGERHLQAAEALDRARGTPADALALGHHANLGVIAAQRGDFVRAETYFRSFLAAAERTSMNPLDRVRGLTNLASLISERGDYQQSLAAFESAHELAARAAPDSVALADTLGNLGTARARVGDDAGSTAAYDEALRIRLMVGADDGSIAAILWSLAANAERRGDLESAAALVSRAVAHTDRVAPGGLTAARAYNMAARIALARNQADEARRLQAHGLDIARRLVPGSRLEVAALATMARIDVREQRLQAAAERYAEAVTALNRQVKRLGATLALEAGYIDDADVQRPYVETLLALGREADALSALEAFRARSVLDRLATRDLAFGRTDEAAALARDRRRLAREYDDTLAQLASLSPATAGEKVRALQAHLGDIRERQSLAASNLRRVDPALADQLEPTPPSQAALQQTLPPGTLALVYHLGTDESAVFAISRDRLRVVRLPVTGVQVADRVDRWRRLVDRARDGSRSTTELDDASIALYDALLTPVDQDVRRAERLVIVPDGVLHGLPFAALRRPAGRGTGPSYLAELKPTSVVPSLTARAGLAARPRAARAALSAVALGGVTLGAAAADVSSGDTTVRQALVGSLAALPGSRREAERVAAAFAPRSQLLLGAAATETAVRSVPRDTAILHIASHGLTNNASPLDSALVMSPAADGVAGDNGLLQAWEIFEQVRVDADLVVLSACDTGLGRTFAGEGLLGLTRAFQFAGARAVAASLWRAPDEATAALMEAFYTALLAGRPADEALAHAQRALTQRAETSHPFFWAAFVIDGDAGRLRR